MRANERAEVAADTVFRQPAGDLCRKAALFVLRCSHRHTAVRRIGEGADGKGIALLVVHRPHDGTDVFGKAAVLLRLAHHQVFPALWHFDLVNAADTRIDRGTVHRDDLFAFVAVGLVDGVFHIVHGVVCRQDAAELKECRLQHAVCPVAKADLLGDLCRVDDVELRLALSEQTLYPVRQMHFDAIGRPLAVQEEDAARLELACDVVLCNVALVMDGDKIRHRHIIGRKDRRVAEAQMALRHAARLFRVVLKVRLHVLVRVVADDLDAVLVRADRAVAAKAPKFTGDRALIRRDDIFANAQRVPRHIVRDADGEVVLALGTHVVVDRDHLRGRRILTGQAVTAAQHRDVPSLLREYRADIFIERLAVRAGFLCAVEHGDSLAGLRQRPEKILRAERTVEVHLKEADLAALCAQIFDDFLQAARNAAHRDNDMLGVRVPIVVEEVVVAARQLVDLAHVIFDDGWNSLIIGVDCLAQLEGRVGVDDGGAHERMLTVERVAAEAPNGVPVDEFAQVLVVQHLDLLDLMARAEAVKKVHKRYAALDRAQMCDRRQVHALLHAG